MSPPRSVRARALDALLLALLAFACTLVHVAYLSRTDLLDRVARVVPPGATGRLLTAQLVLAFMILLICSAVGRFLARRYGLPEIGDLAALRRALPWILGYAAIGAPAALFLVDRPLAALVPTLYPDVWTWAVAEAVCGAVVAEVVARFGMMTIFTGIVRRPMIANLGQAVLVVLLVARGHVLAGIPLGSDSAGAMALAAGFLGALASGWFYARFGLAAALLARALVELRIVVLAFP